jgi:N-acetylglucosamine malate deacetylase 1
MKNVLVIAAHPDDEVLGCGGTVARHALHGDKVHLAILAEGVTSRSSERVTARHAAKLSHLQSAADLAGKRLGVASVSCHDFADNRMDSLDLLDVVKQVEKLISAHDPHIVYTHHCGDVNIDHAITHQAVFTACRPLPESRIERLLAFETASSTEWSPPGSSSAFAPNWFVDISATLGAKIDALGAYQTEMRAWPHPRSFEAVEHLARWRGATIGVEAAEAFVLLRNVERG